MYTQELETEIRQQDSLSDRDYSLVKRLALSFAGVCLLAGAIFVMTGNKLYAGSLIAFFACIFGLAHTPFALALLYFVLATESGFLFVEYFTISKALGIVILLSFILTRIRYEFTFPDTLRAILVLVAWATLSLVWAISPIYGFFGWITLALNVGLVIIAVNTITEKKLLDLMMWAFVFGALTASLMSFIMPGRYETQAAEELGRVSLQESGVGSSNLSNTVVLGVLAAFYLFFHARKLTKLFLILMGLVMLYALLRTQTRVALGTVFLAPLLSFVLTAKAGHRLKYFLIAVFMVIIAVVGFKLVLESNLFSQRAKERLQSSKYDIAESGRASIWMESLRVIKRNPILGVGWSNYPLLSFSTGLQAAHNNVLHFTVELGLPGLAIAVWIYLSLFRRALKTQHHALKWLCVVLIFYNLMLGVTMTTYTFKYYWYAIALVIIASNIDLTQEKPADLEYDESEVDYYAQNPTD